MYTIEQREYTIVPVAREKFSGHSAYPNTGTSFEGAQLGAEGYKTGLSIAEEVEFCKELGLATGTLAKSNSTFWSTILNLRLSNDKSNTYRIGSLMDEIKYRVLCNMNRIAKDKGALAKNPRAEFYIEDVEAAAKEEEKILNVKMESMDAFRDLSSSEKKGYLKLYGRRGTNAMSDAFINTSLFNEIDKNPNKFLNFRQNPDISLRIDIEEMLEARTLVKKGTFYSFEDEVIGSSIDSVISFFKDPKRQSIKIAAKIATKEANGTATKKNKKKNNKEEE